MAEHRRTGKLAVILHADVAGSTDLVRQDEQLAHERIQDTFRRFGDTITKYHGSVRELRGDALLAEFERASDAVTAALAFQDNQLKYLSNLNDPIQPTVRVGIALGEVIIADDTITGEGVVLAQRLEQLAESGSIVIQGSAYEAIPGRFPFEYDNLGEHEIKGFDEPIRAYRARLKGGTNLPQPTHTVHRTRNAIIAFASVAVVAAVVAVMWFKPWETRVEPALVERMAFPLPDKPSIAVLPFDNLSGDENQEYFADGITNDIITDLSKFKNLFVISGNSTFSYKGKAVKVQQVAEELGVRYVLEGSIQSTDDRLRINVQLIDAINGHHLWAERYDRDASDFFAVQEDIVRTIVASLAFQVHQEEIERAVRADTDSLKAYDYYQRGWKAYFGFTKEANNKAREYFEKAVELDPNYARAYAFLTWIHVNDSPARWSWGEDPERSLDLALEVAHRAVELDPNDYYSYWALGFAHLHHRNYDRALAEYERAVALNPNDSELLVEMVDLLVSIGRAEQAVTQTKKAMRINPRPPDWMIWNLGSAQYFAEQYDDALATLNQMSDPPNSARQVLAAVLVRLGRVEEARALISKYIETNLETTLEEIKERTWNHQEYLNRYVDDLRTAGLPEMRPLPLPDKPSIAVLPFTNMSNDEEQEYFVDGMTDDLITDLSKFSGLFVIARNSSFTYKGKAVDVKNVARDLGVRYVLEGSVRRAGNQVRINAQLIDATTGGHLWAERYDEDIDNLFTLQDRITSKIVSALAVEFITVEQQSEVKETDSIESYDAYLQGWALYSRQTPKDFAEAIPFFEKAIQLDPNYGRAYAALALTYDIGSERGLSGVLGVKWHVLRVRGRKYLNLAMQHQPTSITHIAASFMSLKQRLYTDAVAHAERAVALEPGNANAHSRLAYVLNYAGDPKGAVAAANQAMRLDPINPSLPLQWIGRAEFALGNLEKSLKWLDRARKHNPTVFPAALVYASASTQLGHHEQAKAALAQYNRYWDPPPTIKQIMYFWPFKDPVVAKRFTRGILMAGLPDSSDEFYQTSDKDRLDGEAIESLLVGYTVTGFGPWDGKRWERNYGNDGTVSWRGPPVEEPTWQGPDVEFDTGTFAVKENMLCEEWTMINEGEEICFPVFRNPLSTLKQKDKHLFMTDTGIYAWSRVN